jgi:hypothetical protein
MQAVRIGGADAERNFKSTQVALLQAAFTVGLHHQLARATVAPLNVTHAVRV